MFATEWVRDYFRGRSLARRPGLVPFAGGAVGYLGYDAAQWFEPALRDDRYAATRYADGRCLDVLSHRDRFRSREAASGDRFDCSY